MNAFVLAGGRSSRMGRDKALLAFHGRLLIEHALETLRSLGFTPAIAGSRDDLAVYAPVIADNYPGRGPLGGIEAALASTSEELNLFLPVDLPLLPTGLLRWMMERAQRTLALATIPRVLGSPQPLCAIYNVALWKSAKTALAAGDGKVMRVVERAAQENRLRIDSFDVETVTASGAYSAEMLPHYWFENLNTPQDFERATLEQSPAFE
jgi:molybdenum cofactor guanylyltransferase